MFQKKLKAWPSNLTFKLEILKFCPLFRKCVSKENLNSVIFFCYWCWYQERRTSFCSLMNKKLKTNVLNQQDKLFFLSLRCKQSNKVEKIFVLVSPFLPLLLLFVILDSFFCQWEQLVGWFVPQKFTLFFVAVFFQDWVRPKDKLARFAFGKTQILVWTYRKEKNGIKDIWSLSCLIEDRRQSYKRNVKLIYNFLAVCSSIQIKSIQCLTWSLI